jgi:ribosomal protein S4
MKKKYRLKYNFIKKYQVDLWGYLTSCLNENNFFKKMFKTFIYKKKRKIRLIRFLLWRPRRVFMYSKRIPIKKFFKTFNKTHIKFMRVFLFFRTYYGDFTIKKFKKYVNSINKRRIDIMSKILFLLESRLDILLYRVNLFKNPREARSFIKMKKIKINNKIINKLKHHIYINDIIDFVLPFKKFLYKNFLQKLLKKNKKILFNYPRYLEINYKIMKFIFIKMPKKNDIPRTWKLNFSFIRNLI